jgi:hypothetical protein
MTLNDFTDRSDRSLVGPMRADGSRIHLANEACKIKGSQPGYEGNRVVLIEASGSPGKIEAVGCWVQTEAEKVEIMFSQGGSDYRTTWVVDYPNWVSSKTDPLYRLYRSSQH